MSLRCVLHMVVGTILCLAGALHAQDIYVAPTGDDTAAGTRTHPLKTIQKAATMIQPGGSCIILSGRYRETVQAIASGKEGAPVRIVAEGNVVFDGTDPLESTWMPHRGAVFKTKLQGPTVEQAFLGDLPLAPARWPNATFEDTWNRSVWASSAKGSRKDLMISPDLATSEIDWAGAIAVLNVGHQYKTWTRKILKHGKGNDRFTYALEERLGDGKDNGPSWWNDKFYITGTLKALDAPGEFFHDAEAGWFYYVSPDGRAPTPGSIHVKRRDYAIHVKAVNDVQLIGVKFHACTVQFDSAERVVMERCEVRFPAFKTMIGETMPQDRQSATPVTSMSGNNNVIQNCSVAYSSGEGIAVQGQYNRVENCVVHDVCWSGSINFAGIRIRSIAKDEPSSSVVSRCTVYNVGNVGIYHQGLSNVIEHNLVHHTGLACHDIAAIHTGSPNTADSVVRYNVIHHSTGKGIRGDDQTRKLTIHHNLVYLCREGIICKGDFNKVYNNTILGYGNGIMILPTREEPKKWWTRNETLKVQNSNSLFFNNYVEAVTYRKKPLPENKGIAHNVEYNKKKPFVDTLVRADRKSLEAGTLDARPGKGSPLIDAGRHVEGLTDGYVGNAPDIGAFESGKPLWEFGAECLFSKTPELRVQVEE